MIIVLCVAFEVSSYGWNTELKFPDALYHIIACDNRRLTLFHDTADDHTQEQRSNLLLRVSWAGWISSPQAKTSSRR